MKRLMLGVAVLACSCSSLQVVRASTNDFLKRKATTVTVNATPEGVQPLLDQLFFERGYRASGTQAGAKGSKLIFYKGPRVVPPDLAAYGIQLGSWFAARVAVVNGATEITLMGKPMVGTFELCSDHDKLLEDIKYTCTDTKLPPDWAGMRLISGRDETEVVSWVLTGLYERLKH